MPDASQFTLSLFDNTALGWTVPTPAAASECPSHVTLEEDDEPASENHSPASRGCNLYLASDRPLARGWPARARDNISAVRLSKELEATGRAPTPDEQRQLIRFVGFGATELAQNAFPLPGATAFREGWEEMGAELAALATPEDTPPCSARPNMPTTPRSRSCARSGGLRSTSASPEAASSSPVWAPACSSRSCRTPCATAAA